MTTQEIIKWLLDTANDVTIGNANGLEKFVDYNRIAKALETAKEVVKEDAMKEANLYPEKVVEMYGAKIEKRSGSTTWDFSNIHQWVKLNDDRKELEKLAKSSIGFAGDIVDADGVIVNKPTPKYGQETIAVTIKS